MERNTSVRKTNTSTADLLTWSEVPPPDSPSSASRFAVRSHQSSDEISKVVLGSQVTDEEVESLNKRFPKEVTWVLLNGMYKHMNINIVCPGKDSTLGVKSVGTVHASLVTYASNLAIQPDLIINAGIVAGIEFINLPIDYRDILVLVVQNQ